MAHVKIERGELRRVGTPAAAIVAALVGGTAIAFALETWLGLRDASSVYLLAVAAVAIAFGTVPAIATSVGSFVIYNFLFIDPRLSLIVGGPQELLNLLLLLGLGVLIARLAGMQRDRAAQAARREREARALFAISRLFSGEEPVEVALSAAVERLAADARMEAVWVGLGPVEGQERVAVRTPASLDAVQPLTYALLRREADEGRAEWMRIHLPRSSRADVSLGAELPRGAYRVELAVGGDRIGSLWALRAVSAGQPHLEETRLLAASADQMSQAVHRERLARQTVELEVARRSDELKSALLVSVSHDLRTPLAAIRAAAGTLADADIEMDADDRRTTATAIDEEAQRLNRLVGNLIDMSRVEGRDLAPQLEAIPVADAVESVVERLQPLLGQRPIEHELPADLPPVRADATLLDQVLANLLENAARHTPPGTPVRVTAATERGGVLLSVEDGGPGVPDEALPRLFDRFFRVKQAADGSGSGLGLAVVRGFVEAMGGQVGAANVAGGGLRITLQLPVHARQPVGDPHR